MIISTTTFPHFSTHLSHLPFLILFLYISLPNFIVFFSFFQTPKATKVLLMIISTTTFPHFSTHLSHLPFLILFLYISLLNFIVFFSFFQTPKATKVLLMIISTTTFPHFFHTLISSTVPYSFPLYFSTKPTTF
jgi:hypothetical protein